MGVWKRFFVSFLMLPGLFLGSAIPVSAISKSAEITVTGVVQPARYIIINKSGQLTEIISNTKKQIKPVVFLDNIKIGNEKELTNNLLTDYNRVLAENVEFQMGILKIHVREDTITSSVNFNIFNIIDRQISIFKIADRLYL